MNLEYLQQTLTQRLEVADVRHECLLIVGNDPEFGTPHIEVHILGVDHARRATLDRVIDILLDIEDESIVNDSLAFAHGSELGAEQIGDLRRRAVAILAPCRASHADRVWILPVPIRPQAIDTFQKPLEPSTCSPLTAPPVSPHKQAALADVWFEEEVLHGGSGSCTTGRYRAA